MAWINDTLDITWRFERDQIQLNGFDASLTENG